MKTFDELRAEHEKQTAELHAQHAIAMDLPQAPKFVVMHGPKSAPSVIYSCDSFRACVELFKVFAARGILNIEHTKGNYTHLQPAGLSNSERSEPAHKGDFCVYLKVDQLHGNGAPSVALHWYAMANGRIVHVQAQTKQATPGQYRFGARVTETRGRGARLESRVYAFNPALNGYADGRIAYGCYEFGPIKKSADMRYMFVADDGQACQQFGHALAQLQNICDEFEPIKGAE